MLAACRATRLGRILLLTAALFAVVGSFGLHPEPLGEEAVAGSSAPEWSGRAIADAASHGCPACLAHRSVSVAGLAVFVPASHAPRPVPVPLPTGTLALSSPSTVDGRAPPLSA